MKVSKAGRRTKLLPECHELHNEGGFVPPGRITSEASIPAETVPDGIQTAPQDRATESSAAAMRAPDLAGGSADETDLPHVFSQLAARLLQCLEPDDWSGLATGLLSRGKLQEEELGLPLHPQHDFSLDQLLKLTAPKAPLAPPSKQRIDHHPAPRAQMPAVPMQPTNLAKPRPNLSLVELLGQVPSLPSASADKSVSPEAQRAQHAHSLEPEKWVPLSSVETLGQTGDMMKHTEEAGVSHVSTLEPMEATELRGTSSTRSEASVIGSGENRSSLASLDDEDPLARHEDLDRGREVKDCTSLVLRNLPLMYDQQQAMELIDGKGFSSLYDLVWWFPSKKESKRKTSCCFINFRSIDSAQKFAQEFHQMKLDDQRLNVSTARVQGFTENFVKYWHLTQKESVCSLGSICSPWYAQDQLDKVTAETWARAKALKEEISKEQSQGPLAVEDAETATTVVIRNLPTMIEDQQQAIDWLDELGYGKASYNFLLYVPRKTSRKGAKQKTLAYLFVNFLDSNRAKVCMENLPEQPTDGMRLSVAYSYIQGLQACVERFHEVAQSGRLVPFIPEGNSRSVTYQ